MIKRSTLVGWIMITLSIMLSVWVISSGSSHADQTTADGFVLNDEGTRVISYTGDGGNVSIPAGVTTVDGSVFANNSTITGVTFPSSVTSMGSNVFSGCSNLQSVNLGSVSSIPPNTFQNCYSLSSVTIPSTVTSIGDYSFYGCDALGSVTLPSSVTSIADTAFDECDNLNSLSIPSNGFYSSSDGCLYNNSGSRLIMVPAGKGTITFPGSITTIGSGAFSGNYNIDSITVPETVSSIENGAFTDSGINTVTIPTSVTSIGSQSGWDPAQIYGYSGTAAEKYANSNNIPFIALDGGDDGDDGDDGDYDDGDDGDDGDYDDPDDGDDGDDGDDSDSGSGNKKPGGNSGGNGGSGGGRSGNGGSTNGGRSGRSSGGKDATPKTADGDFDPRFALCLSLLMGGAGIIVLSRKRQMELVSERRPRN